MERKDREGTNRTEALLQAFRQRMGDGYQIEPAEGDRKDVIFKIIKDGEQEGIILPKRQKDSVLFALQVSRENRSNPGAGLSEKAGAIGCSILKWLGVVHGQRQNRVFSGEPQGIPGSAAVYSIQNLP